MSYQHRATSTNQTPPEGPTITGLDHTPTQAQRDARRAETRYWRRQARYWQDRDERERARLDSLDDRMAEAERVRAASVDRFGDTPGRGHRRLVDAAREAKVWSVGKSGQHAA